MTEHDYGELTMAEVKAQMAEKPDAHWVLRDEDKESDWDPRSPGFQLSAADQVPTDDWQRPLRLVLIED